MIFITIATQNGSGGDMCCVYTFLKPDVAHTGGVGLNIDRCLITFMEDAS